MSRGQASMGSLNQSKDVDGQKEPLLAPQISQSHDPDNGEEAAHDNSRAKSLNFSNKVVPARDGGDAAKDENVAEEGKQGHHPNEEL